MKYSIEHFGIMAEDPAALASWYQDVLGFDELFIPPGAAHPVFVRDSSGFIIEFFKMPGGFKHPDDQIRKAQHLCITAENYEETLKDLKSKGVEFPEDGFDIFQDGRVRFFRDPEGNWIHLVYRTQVPWN